VKRFGTLAVRVLRAVFAADGPLDVEEGRTLAALIGSLGLSQEDSAPLYNESAIPVEQLDVYGEIDAAVVRALIRGAWHASAWDKIDPREEHVVRTIAQKLAVPQPEVEQMRADADGTCGCTARGRCRSRGCDPVRDVGSRTGHRRHARIACGHVAASASSSRRGCCRR